MSREYRSDPYVYPGTSVLLNSRGLRDQPALTQFESDISVLALAELATTWLPGRYDLHHLKAFHQFIFGAVYPWAGQLRVVAIHKQDTNFCLPQYLEAFAGDVFSRLARHGHLRHRSTMLSARHWQTSGAI